MPSRVYAIEGLCHRGPMPFPPTISFPSIFDCEIMVIAKQSWKTGAGSGGKGGRKSTQARSTIKGILLDSTNSPRHAAQLNSGARRGQEASSAESASSSTQSPSSSTQTNPNAPDTVKHKVDFGCYVTSDTLSVRIGERRDHNGQGVISVKFLTKPNGKNIVPCYCSTWRSHNKDEALEQLRAQKSTINKALNNRLLGQTFSTRSELCQIFSSTAKDVGVTLQTSPMGETKRNESSNALILTPKSPTGETKRNEGSNAFILRLNIASHTVADEKYWRGVPYEDDGYEPSSSTIPTFLNQDPRRCIVSFAPASRALHLLPDVTISMAAKPTAAPQPEFTHTIACRLGRPKGEVSSNSVQRLKDDRSGMREAFLETWPARFMHQFASHFAGKGVTLQEAQVWIDERVVDWPEPVRRLHMYIEKNNQRAKNASPLFSTEMDKWGEVGKLKVCSVSRHTVAKAIKLAHIVYDELQKQYGRDHMETAEGFHKAREEWYKRFLMSEIEERGLTAVAGVPLVKTASLEIGECTGASCQIKQHFCACTISGVHPSTERIPCEKMDRWTCMEHANMNFPQSRKHNASYMEAAGKEMQRYDARRGVSTSASVVHLKAPYIIFGGVDYKEWVNADTLRKSVQEVKDGDYSLLVALAPNVLSQNALSTPPNSRVEQSLAREVTSAFQLATFSLDLSRQYMDWKGGSGQLQGHNPNSCRQVPQWYQMGKGSHHPIQLALYIATVHISNCQELDDSKRKALSRQLDSLINSTESLSSTYGQGSTSGQRKGMSGAQCSLSDECHAFIDLESPPTLALSWHAALRDLKQVIPDAQRHRSLLQVTPKVSITESEQDAFQALQMDFRTEEARLTNMSQEETQKLIGTFQPIIKQIEAHFGTKFERNKQDFPVLFWGQSTSTIDVFVLALAAFVQAIWVCDAGVCKIVVTWRSDGWWRVVVVWLLYVAKHGTVDVVSQLPMDLSGETHRALKPTLVAHVDHRRPFFPNHQGHETLEEATMTSILNFNATVQPWILNKLIKSKRIGAILHIIHQSRPGACTLMRRLASANLLNIDEETINSVECGNSLLRQEALEFLRSNSTLARERHH